MRPDVGKDRGLDDDDASVFVPARTSRTIAGSVKRTARTSVAPAEKWRGGQLVLRPGKPGLQEKAWPVETFFNKVEMVRNPLRTLE